MKAIKPPMIGVIAALFGEQCPLSGLDLTDLAAGVESNAPDNGGTIDLQRQMAEFLPQLRRFARSLTHDADLSEDLVQETYARALAHLDQWRPDTRLDSWMYRIAQNLWIDQLRAKKVRGEFVDIAVIGNLSDCDGRVVMESRLSLLELRECIAKLPADQRVLLGLVCVDGFSYKEAALALGSPAGTIMSRLARARHALHDAMARQRREVSR